MQAHDFAGALGVLFIVGAYLLLQLGRINASQLTYSVMNAAGAALVLFSLCFDFNVSAFLVEAFWLAISFFGIAKYMLSQRQE